jgi:type IV pilus assembly protein PilV
MDGRKQKPIRKMEGSTLVEVLVSVLIFSCGMLAIAGLQAVSFKNTGDVQYRAEAIHLVNAYVGKIKAMTPAAMSGGAGQVVTLFESGGSEFVLFENELAEKLPEAGVPVVNFIADASLPGGTRLVDITVTWQPPGEDVTRRYTQTSVIGNN